MSTPAHPRDARAQKKADKAYANASRPWYKKKRFWILGLLLLAVLAAALGGGGDKIPAPQSGSAPAGNSSQESAPAEKPIVVTADKLQKDLKANALKAAKTYKGKRVTVTGAVSNIDASGDYFSIQGSDQFDLTIIQIFIDENQKSTVEDMSTDQKVTVTGEVTDVGEVLGYSIKADTIK